MKTLVTLITVAILAVKGTVGFALSGLYDPSATTPHHGVIHWPLSTASHASGERRAADVKVPDNTGPEADGSHAQHDHDSSPSTMYGDTTDNHSLLLDHKATAPIKTKEADGHDHQH